MQWFGEKPFGAVCQQTEKADTPVGHQCDWCEEAIVQGDDGMLIPSRPSVFHRACFLRQIAGSVGHQTQQCSCFGGSMEDPPGMTRRQAAQAATQLFETTLQQKRGGNVGTGHEG